MAGHFTADLWITPVDANGKKWRTRDPFTWHFGYKGSLIHAVVPGGFVYDLASVPWLAQPLVPHTIAPQASALHDFGYRHNQALVVAGFKDGNAVYEGDMIELSKADWDMAFYEGMLAKGVTAKRAGLAYAGVDIGGNGTWKRHRRRNEKWNYND